MICYSQGGKSILDTSHLQGMTIRPREQILAKTLHIKVKLGLTTTTVQTTLIAPTPPGSPLRGAV